MHEIIVDNIQNELEINSDLEELIKIVIKLVLSEEKVNKNTEVSVILVNDEHIKELNKTYRFKNVPTDVLSFAMRENTLDDDLDGHVISEYTGTELLGDIVISVQRAKAQAEEFGHSFRRELAYLTVHGMLHLLGYDHESESDKNLMRQREEAILKRLDLTRGIK